MESFSQAGHLTLHLPEIISKIMDFLPTSDLESASLVNTTWELEALKYLMARNPVEIQLKSDVNDSTDLVTLTNLSPTWLKIVPCASLPLEDLLPKIELLNSLNFKTVTKLNIELPLDTTLRHVASRLVKICESFRNLASLEFQPTLYNWKGMYSSLQDWKDLFPDNFSPPENLIALNVNMSRLYPDTEESKWEHVIPLATRILTVFSRIRNLSLIDVPCGVLEKDGIILPHLVSLSLTRTFLLYTRHHAFLEHFKFSSLTKDSFVNVTRYEFNAFNTDTIVNGVDLLQLLAPRLEHVCISGVPNVIPRKANNMPPHIIIPILPRLKVFEILREQTVYRDLSVSWFRPFLYLKFETGKDEVKFVYGKQFPVLEKLIVRVVPQSIPAWRTYAYKKPNENLHFEATMLFLWETFLSEGLEPCETLRNLDISFPTGASWNVGKLRMKRGCECDDETEICQCWGWREDFPDFYDRISTTFPNLNYDVVEMGKRNVRVEKIKKFKELGTSLGVFHDKARICEHFDEILRVGEEEIKYQLL